MVKQRKLSATERLHKLSDLVIDQIDAAFKKYRVKNHPKSIILDRGGMYLADKKEGDEKKTFLIVSWVAAGKIKEVFFDFENFEEAKYVAAEIHNKYTNSRVYQAIIPF